jgi:hypothetical protein
MISDLIKIRQGGDKSTEEESETEGLFNMNYTVDVFEQMDKTYDFDNYLPKFLINDLNDIRIDDRDRNKIKTHSAFSKFSTEYECSETTKSSSKKDFDYLNNNVYFI